MRRFDFNRFRQTLCWSLTMDRGWFLRTTLSWIVIHTLLFLFFTCVVRTGHPTEGYTSCVALLLFTLLGFLTLGPSFMFLSMKGRHADQPLLMLPASNLEKYLVRYSYWLLLLPCMAVAFVMSDLLQLLVNILLGHENAALVMSHAGRLLNDSYSSVPDMVCQTFLSCVIWVHSFYALGATFFRAHKYNWVLTSVALILGMMLIGTMQAMTVIDALLTNYNGYCNCLFLSLAVFNFWLSYRLFCRTQVIGRFINI